MRTYLPLLVLLLVPALAHGQEDSLEAAERRGRPWVAYPAPIESGEIRFSAGLSVATLPRLLVEEEVNQSPMIEGRMIVGLPANLTASAHLSTNFYVASHLSAGLRWGFELGPVAAGIGLEGAAWFGLFDLSGFDNTVYGFMAYPNLSLGLQAGEVLITARAELQYLTSFFQYAGDIEVIYSRDRITGTAFGVYLEQPLWKNHHVMLGAKVTNADFFYQGWMAFNTFRRRQLYPELFFAFLIH